MRTHLEQPKIVKREFQGFVHCPMCTHTVETTVIGAGRRVYVRPGEKCPRCSSPLDAGFVLQIHQAA